jgi:hypothetical protein
MNKKTHESLTIKQLVKELKSEMRACKKDMRQYHDNTVEDIMADEVDNLTSNEAFDRGFIRGLEIALSYIK